MRPITQPGSRSGPRKSPSGRAQTRAAIRPLRRRSENREVGRLAPRPPALLARGDMSDETPADRFKGVLAGAARAIAHEPEVEVNWTADAPSQAGNNFRVPMPGRNLPRAAAMEARGYADSFALKLRHHSDALHNRHAPGEPVARACYDAVERVRYEALGANEYEGMRGNLDAATRQRLASDPINRASNAEDVPIQQALALLLRERLTGQPVPEGARRGVEMLRGFIEDKAAGDFDALAHSLDNQSAFQSLSLDMLQHLELTRAEPVDQPPEEADDGDQENEEEQEEDDGSETGQEQQPSDVAADSSEGEE